METWYITNNPDIACICEDNNVTYVMIDLEKDGKKERQGNIDAVFSEHTIEDIQKVKKKLNKTHILVRTNPPSKKLRNEIEEILKHAPEAIMLPYFSTAYEVQSFLDAVKGRAKVFLLLERYQALKNIDEILKLEGIDRIHVGLNDLHLELKMKFMFEILSEGILDDLSQKVLARNIKFGFGGVGRIGFLSPKAEDILSEHVRIGSTSVILSRSFCRQDNYKDINKFAQDFSLRKKDFDAAMSFIETLNKNQLQKTKKAVCSEIKCFVENTG